MEFMISGRNLTVSDRFREYASEKISKLEHLTEKVQRIDAKVSKQTNARTADPQLTVELTVQGRGSVIRAEAHAADKFAAFDVAYGKLMERLRRVKDRKKIHHGRHTPVAVSAATATLEPVGTGPLAVVAAAQASSQQETKSERSRYEIENDIPAGIHPY